MLASLANVRLRTLGTLDGHLPIALIHTTLSSCLLLKFLKHFGDLQFVKGAGDIDRLVLSCEWVAWTLWHSSLAQHGDAMACLEPTVLLLHLPLLRYFSIRSIQLK